MGALKYGTHLRAPGGSGTAIVAGGWVPQQRDGWMWGLTVPGGNDHDFYIDTVAASVLVHNCTEYGPFHRLESPTQEPETAQMQEQNGELLGKSARYSNIPSVKAYNGPLPEGARGIEFYTDVEPTDVGSGKPGDNASWYRGSPGVQNIDDEWVKISCRVTINTQC